jgi:hypothetical protein
MIGAADAAVSATLLHVPAEGVQIEETTLGGVRTFVISPPGLDPADRRVYLDIHGGALIHGAGEGCRHGRADGVSLSDSSGRA